MKHSISRHAILLLVALFITASIHAQQHAKPKWVSEKGYWVIETSGKTKNNHIIRFYSNEGQLVYQESVANQVLKISKRKVKMELKKVLEKSVDSWQARRKSAENPDLVAQAL